MSIPSRYYFDILDACQALHSHVTGSGDGVQEHDLRLMRDWLKKRVSEWGAGVSGDHARAVAHRAYDSAVYLLAVSALHECEGVL